MNISELLKKAMLASYLLGQSDGHLVKTDKKEMNRRAKAEVVAFDALDAAIKALQDELQETKQKLALAELAIDARRLGLE